MSSWFDCADETQRSEGLSMATAAVLRGELVVLPTDTVYGLGADAFRPEAVASLLAAKGRGREGQALIDEFWPGGLTLVCVASRSLVWDLGDTKGTVAIRMPEHPVALALLAETGPMAVSSANLTGVAAAVTAAEAREQLGDSVAVYLDGGACPGGTASTIVDLTGGMPRLLRSGVIPIGKLREVAAIAIGDDAA